MCYRNTEEIGLLALDHVYREVGQTDSYQCPVVGEDGGENSAVPGLIEHRPDLDSLGDTHRTGDEDRRSTTHEVEKTVHLHEERGGKSGESVLQTCS